MLLDPWLPCYGEPQLRESPQRHACSDEPLASVIAGEYRARRGHQGPCLRTLRECCPRWCHQSCDEEALNIARRSVSLTAGSFNTSRAYADFTGPLNERKTLLYRLNLGYENSDTFRDLQKLTTQIVAPSITYCPQIVLASM